MNWESIKNFFTTAGVDLLRGIIIIVVGFFLVHWIVKVIERNEHKMKMEPTLRDFIKNLIRLGKSGE